MYKFNSIVILNLIFICFCCEIYKICLSKLLYNKFVVNL